MFAYSVVLMVILPSFWISRPGIESIELPWSNCSTWTDQLVVESVDADEWPPARNESLSIIVKGVARESFVYGQYNKTVVYRDYSLPSVYGPLNDLGIHLPSQPGPLVFTIMNKTIPYIAPGGSYDFYVKASDQDGAEILCIKISWILDSF